MHAPPAAPSRDLSCGKCAIRGVPEQGSKGTAGERRRRASVAVVLRPVSAVGDSGEETVQILLIKRAPNPRDRWAGDLAFPGGCENPGETDLETAIRECKEEVGLDLSAGGYMYCGQLDDIVLGGRERGAGMVLSSFVFCCDDDATAGSALKPQEEEVACAWWASVDELFDGCGAESFFPTSRVVPWLRRSPKLEAAARLLGCDTVAFRGVYVTPPSTHADAPPADFFLWGISYDIFLHLRASAEAGEAQHAPMPQERLAFRFSRAPWVVDACCRGFYFSSRLLSSDSSWSWGVALGTAVALPLSLAVLLPRFYARSG